MLESHRAYEDVARGISERFCTLRLSAGRTIGVLSTPSTHPRTAGWVICHSFGPEQTPLYMTEVHIARTLAAVGFPVLRFHCQGYGDSEDLDSGISLAGHLRDSGEVVEQMPALAGVDEVGLIGLKFGGVVASLLAQRLALPYCALIAPPVTGRQYLAKLLRLEAVTDVTSGVAPAVGRPTGLKGHMMNADALEEIHELDLLVALRAFHARALIVQISTTDRPQGALERLRHHLQELGAPTAFAVVTDRAAARFGYDHYERVESRVAADAFARLNAALAQSVMDWVQRATSAAGEGVTA